MVRATFSGFSTALSALMANQKRLDIVGQNLSNLNTPGYTRQQLETSSLNYSSPTSQYTNGSEIAVGFGVSMNKVSQIRDPYLDAQYRAQINKAGYHDALQSSFDALSKVLDESDVDGIRQALADINSALVEMQESSKVNDVVYETELRSRFQAMTNLLNDAARKISDAEKAEFNKLDGAGTSEQGSVQKVNELLQQIGDLNHQIKQNQIMGHQSLELLDQRNQMLDELASYVPIEISYYKDADHDGKMLDTDPDSPTYNQIIDAPKELYEYDAYNNIIGKKEWPDDLKVELVYKDPDGTPQRMTLINGTEGGRGNNYGKLTVDGSSDKPSDVSIVFNPAASSGEAAQRASAAGIQLSGGYIQASLDMLGKTGTGTPVNGASGTLDDVRGFQYYMNRLDDLAKHFAKTFNELNVANGGVGDVLLVNKENPDEEITALTIGLNEKWISGDVHLSTGGENTNDTVLSMIEALEKTHPELGNKSFADYINNVSTTLANDSKNNTTSLKTSMTVLNSIQNSRDSISGVSLDEEAANMMSYMSAYNAVSRVMTALDETLNTLINNTGLVGR
ncbi:MAG: flagellar basal body protein [Clostridiales bacterium]|nr:flagellar basal body protein [Clostridiales bacterium]